VTRPVGTARDRGFRTSRWKAPRTCGGVLLFAEPLSPKGSVRVRSFPPCCSSGLLGTTRFADFAERSEMGVSSMRGGFAPLPRGVNVPVSRATSGCRGHAATTCNVVGDVTGMSPQSPPLSLFQDETVRLRDMKIVSGVVRDRSAWLVGCLHTGRASWATTKGVECRCVQLVWQCGTDSPESRRPTATGTS